MPRRNRPERPPPRELGAGLGGTSSESAPDGEWLVRSVPGVVGKAYRCPGCHQTIPSGVAHVVAWPADGGSTGTLGLDDRRHWHTGCWPARHRRR
jgi:hypothetical protein